MQSLAVATRAHPTDRPASNVPRAPHDILRSLQPIGAVSTYDRDQAIFREGDSATHWYQVVSGVLRTCKLLADGRRQIGEFLLPGDIFGFEVGDRHTIDVEAIGPTSVMRFARSRVRLLLDTEAGLAARLPQLAFETVAKAHARLLVLARQTAQERIVGFLLEMALRVAPGGNELVLPMIRQDIADYLCLTVETVCRMIADLKRDGLIQVPSPQHIRLIDRPALEDMVSA